MSEISVTRAGLKHPAVTPQAAHMLGIKAQIPSGTPNLGAGEMRGMEEKCEMGISWGNLVLR